MGIGRSGWNWRFGLLGFYSGHKENHSHGCKTYSKTRIIGHPHLCGAVCAVSACPIAPFGRSGRNYQRLHPHNHGDSLSPVDRGRKSHIDQSARGSRRIYRSGNPCNSGFEAGGTSQIWAIGAGLLATLCYASSLNYTKSLNHVDPSILATIALTGAAVSAITAALIFEGVPVVTKSETWFALIGIGVFTTALAFQIMYRMLPRVGPTNFTVTRLPPSSPRFRPSHFQYCG